MSRPNEVGNKTRQNQKESSLGNHVSEKSMTKEFTNRIQLDQNELSTTNINVSKVSMSEEGANDFAQKESALLQNLRETSLRDNVSHTPGKIMESQRESANQDNLSEMLMASCETIEHSLQRKTFSNQTDSNEKTKHSLDEMPSQRIINPILDNSLETTTDPNKIQSEKDQTSTNIPIYAASKLQKQSSESIIATSNCQRKRIRKKKKLPRTKNKIGSLNIPTDQQATKVKRQPKRKRRQTSKQSELQGKPPIAGDITSSSEDDIPLANIKFRKYSTYGEQFDDSDKDETFKPSAKDNNSTDTEYSSNLSDMERYDRKINKKLFEDFKASKISKS